MKVTEIKELENKVKPDLFIAIHQNAHDIKSYRGENVYAVSEESLKVASAINERLKADKTIPNNRMNLQRSKEFVVLQANADIPAILVETGYISNAQDVKILNSPQYKDLAAQNIVEGIKEFFSTKKQPASNKFPSLEVKSLEPLRAKLTATKPFSIIQQAAN